MKQVYIYTDGACSHNPGPGGWGVVLIYGDYRKELSGADSETTNNRMELTAVIEGLRALNQPCQVTLFTDSKYIVDSVNLGRLEKWSQNGWRKANKGSVLNADLWEDIVALTSIHQVEFRWVKGHTGHPENERCDKLAKQYT